MPPLLPIPRRCSLLCCALLLCGCEASLSVDLTDGPIDGAEAVVLRVEGIDLLQEDGTKVSVDAAEAADVDFLQYRNGTTLRLIDGAEVPAAHYTGVRLRYADGGSYVVRSDGGEVAIDTPEADEFADADLDIGDEDTATLVLDLELRFSLDDATATGGGYVLNPVLRVVESGEEGVVSGTVASAIVEGDDCRQGRTLLRGVSVYAYAGSGVTPTDYARDDVTAVRPLSSAAVYLDEAADVYRYRFGHLPEGSYTLALTCEADSERPATADGLDFVQRRNVTVEVAATRTIDFSTD